jgi:hypothetical protein
LLSAEEDFQRNTLDKINGVLEKVRYLANLKTESGALQHWGLERQYGSQRAAEVLQDKCAEQLQVMLQEELATLWREAQSLSHRASQDSETFLKGLMSDLEAITPERLTKLQARHLKAILVALSEIAAHQRSKSDSLQLRRLDQ